MSRFNSYMNAHFRGCQVLAHAYDKCRQRDVSIHRIPGEWECVGVTDGTDAWIAPVIRGAQYFHSVDTWQILEDLRNGKTITSPVRPGSTRRRIAFEEEGAAPAEEAEPARTAPRRRVRIEDEDEQPLGRRRIIA